MRCHAEEMFGVPHTATWGGKHEGHRLFSEYSADKDSKKNVIAEIEKFVGKVNAEILVVKN